MEPRQTGGTCDKYYLYGEYEYRSRPEVAAALNLGEELRCSPGRHLVDSQ